ncbi:titin homolog [Aplysia californica]|uniref:Titin homolog n=1 Tax=Aplysia californica TaxID=6500 RepID=A0ABM0ZZ23_APLCA|nr:titin homolog [Aplysia californica]
MSVSTQGDKRVPAASKKAQKSASTPTSETKVTKEEGQRELVRRSVSVEAWGRAAASKVRLEAKNFVSKSSTSTVARNDTSQAKSAHHDTLQPSTSSKEHVAEECSAQLLGKEGNTYIPHDRRGNLSSLGHHSISGKLGTGDEQKKEGTPAKLSTNWDKSAQKEGSAATGTTAVSGPRGKVSPTKQILSFSKQHRSQCASKSPPKRFQKSTTLSSTRLPSQTAPRNVPVSRRGGYFPGPASPVSCFGSLGAKTPSTPERNGVFASSPRKNEELRGTKNYIGTRKQHNVPRAGKVNEISPRAHVSSSSVPTRCKGAFTTLGNETKGVGAERHEENVPAATLAAALSLLKPATPSISQGERSAKKRLGRFLRRCKKEATEPKSQMSGAIDGNAEKSKDVEITNSVEEDCNAQETTKKEDTGRSSKPFANPKTRNGDVKTIQSQMGGQKVPDKTKDGKEDRDRPVDKLIGGRNRVQDAEKNKRLSTVVKESDIKSDKRKTRSLPRNLNLKPGSPFSLHNNHKHSSDPQSKQRQTVTGKAAKKRSQSDNRHIMSPLKTGNSENSSTPSPPKRPQGKGKKPQLLWGKDKIPAHSGKTRKSRDDALSSPGSPGRVQTHLPHGSKTNKKPSPVRNKDSKVPKRPHQNDSIIFSRLSSVESNKLRLNTKKKLFREKGLGVVSDKKSKSYIYEKTEEELPDKSRDRSVYSDDTDSSDSRDEMRSDPASDADERFGGSDLAELSDTDRENAKRLDCHLFTNQAAETRTTRGLTHRKEQPQALISGRNVPLTWSRSASNVVVYPKKQKSNARSVRGRSTINNHQSSRYGISRGGNDALRDTIVLSPRSKAHRDDFQGTMRNDRLSVARLGDSADVEPTHVYSSVSVSHPILSRSNAARSYAHIHETSWPTVGPTQHLYEDLYFDYNMARRDIKGDSPSSNEKTSFDVEMEMKEVIIGMYNSQYQMAETVMKLKDDFNRIKDDVTSTILLPPFRKEVEACWEGTLLDYLLLLGVMVVQILVQLFFLNLKKKIVMF